MAGKSEKSQNILLKSVKRTVPTGGWPVYRDFEIDESDNDVFVYAPRVAPEIPSRRGIQAVHSAWMGEDLNRVRVYAPLRDAPDLFLKFASLGREGGIVRDEAVEVMLDWIKTYGALGLQNDEGRGESLAKFELAVENASRCLELYEAATADSGARGDPDVEALDRLGDYGQTPKEKREWALQEVTGIVSKRIKKWCYPQLYRVVNTEVNRTVGFEQGWGFRSLLGAMYLQMMWLLTEGSDSPRCKKEGCNRIVRIGEYEPGDEKSIEEFEKRGGGRPPRYRTRSDKEYCSDNCRVKAYYHNVKKFRDRRREES